MKIVIFVALLGLAIASPLTKTNEQQRTDEPVTSDIKTPQQKEFDVQQKVEVPPVQEEIKQEKIVPESKVDLSNYVFLVPINSFREFLNTDNTERTPHLPISTPSLPSLGGGSSGGYGYGSHGIGGISSIGGLGGIGGVRTEGQEQTTNEQQFSENMPFQPARSLVAPLISLLNPFATLTASSK